MKIISIASKTIMNQPHITKQIIPALICQRTSQFPFLTSIRNTVNFPIYPNNARKFASLTKDNEGKRRVGIIHPLSADIPGDLIKNNKVSSQSDVETTTSRKQTQARKNKVGVIHPLSADLPGDFITCVGNTAADTATTTDERKQELRNRKVGVVHPLSADIPGDFSTSEENTALRTEADNMDVRKQKELRHRQVGVVHPLSADIPGTFVTCVGNSAPQESPKEKKDSRVGVIHPLSADIPINFDTFLENPTTDEEDIPTAKGKKTLKIKRFSKTKHVLRKKKVGGIVHPNTRRKMSTWTRRNMSMNPLFSTDHIEHAKSEDFLSNVPVGPPDSMFDIMESFHKCTDPRKLNVCIGTYRDSEGSPWVLPSVREAEKRMLESNLHKEYAPIEGDMEFVDLALKFAYGENADLDIIAGVQTLGGTGACRIGGEFFRSFLPEGRIYLPDPTWGNHIPIFRNCGLDVHFYRYYDASTNALDYASLMEDIQMAPSGSVIFLHACAHNPTGCDPSTHQWEEIADLMQDKNLHPFLDLAYQGFASGDAEKDASTLRMFVDKGLKIALAQSFAKNFGLYGERCGTLSFVCDDEAEKEAVLSQLKLIIRPMYSNPPIHGSTIVKTVLGDEMLRNQYYSECAEMARRIRSMRELLVSNLEQVGSMHDWSHITDQIGMYAYTGLTPKMCDELTDHYSIFLTRNGRISLAGLNEGNVGYVADAIHSATDGKCINCYSSM